jgi:hypothetical protein
MEMVNGNNSIISSTTDSKYYIWILSTMSVVLHHHFNVLVDMLPPEVDSSISAILGSTKKLNML